MATPTVPSVAVRSSGAPPSQRSTGVSGNRKTVCLPSQLALRPTANIPRMPRKKSQFDVWGATITTNLGQSGNSPSIRQPNRRSRRRASVRDTLVPRLGRPGPVRSVVRMAGTRGASHEGRGRGG
jgi:hypothetical protein